MHCTEWQKRGLPHAHILVILAQSSAPKTADDFDNFVSAELPPKKDPRCRKLRKIIRRCNIHHKCDVDGKRRTCWDHQKRGCRFRYSKDFVETRVLKDGYHAYRRRPGDSTRMKYWCTDVNGERSEKSFLMDNRWVVPYNPYLPWKWNSHVNVEITTGIQAVKYLYK